MYATIITRSKILLGLFLFLQPLVSLCQDNEAILKIGQKIAIHSEVLKETREVWVYLPPNYSDKYFQAQNFPVLYVLDGDLHFHSLSGLVHILGSGINQTFAIPEMIIVAIPNTNRVRDLIPTHSTMGLDGKEYSYLDQSGGTDDFLKFITTELAEKIESSYRTFPYRILIGQSFGGIAVIHALLTKPESFNAYVAIDPSLWWDNQVLTKKAKQYFDTAELKGRCFYLAQANSRRSWDTVDISFQAIKDFATVLEKNNQSGLKWKYKYYPDDTHSSVAFIAEYDALRFIFEKYSTNYEDISNAKELKEWYRRLTEETQVTFIPPERVTQHFGSIYLSLSKYDVAQGFFEMNLDNYPHSSSAYANMGQFWKSMGDKKKALEYYDKSLKIYPGNEDSKSNVESLKKELRTKSSKID